MFDSIEKHLAEGKETREAKLAAKEPVEAKKVLLGHHTISLVPIYYSTDYGQFKTMLGNRQLNKQKITRIKKDIAGGLNVLMYCPVIVHEKNGKLEIIDGQHRFYVAKDIKHPVYYVIVKDEMKLHDIAKINSTTERWKPKDFINCYSQQENEHYTRLESFMKKYGFPLSVCLQMLKTGSALKDAGEQTGEREEFEQGFFQVTKYDEAIALAETIKRFESFSAHKSRGFIVAVCRIIKANVVPIDDIIEKFLKNQDRMNPQSNWKDYLTNLENIYNVGAHTRKVIY